MNPETLLKYRYHAVFGILLAFAVYLRLRYLFQPSIWVDETAYYLESLYFLKTFTFGNFTPISAMTLFPISLIIFWGLFFDIFIAGRLMALTFTIAGTIYMYLIGKNIKNEAVGLIAAALFIFNPFIWFNSSRTLIDAPVTTMFIICAYYLIKLDKQFNKRNAIYLAISFLLALQTKFISVLFVLIMLAYLAIRFIFFTQNKKELILSAARSKWPYLGVLAGLLLLYQVWSYVLAGLTQFKYNPFFINLAPQMLNDYIIWLALAGVVFAIAYRKKEDFIVITWGAMLYLAFTFYPAGNYDRYILPATPAVMLLASITMVEISELITAFVRANKEVIRILSIILIFYLVLPDYYASANSMILGGSFAFTGYDEAGQWIKENVEDNATIMVMSTSWANLFSENLYGRITVINTADFLTPGHMADYISNISNPVYLITDQWEAGAQPRWMAPSQESVTEFGKLGFELIKVVEQRYPKSDEEFAEVYNKIGLLDINIDDRSLDKIPAVFIFKRK